MQVFSTTREFRRSAFFEALRRAGMIVLPREPYDRKGRMKLGTLTFTTDGRTIKAFFTDQDGNSEDVLSGDSLNDCSRAVDDMVLLMQHRNGIVNFNADGSVAAGVTPELLERLEKVAATDTGKGW